MRDDVTVVKRVRLRPHAAGLVELLRPREGPRPTLAPTYFRVEALSGADTPMGRGRRS